MDLIIALLNLAAVPSGWFLVHLLSVRREKSSEWRSLARQTAKNVESLERKAWAYHRGQIRNPALEEDLLRRLGKLDSRLVLLNKHLSYISPYSAMRLRKAITLRNFQSSGFMQQPANSDLLREIGAAASELEEILYGGRKG